LSRFWWTTLLVQTNGRAFSLWLVMKLSMWPSSSATLPKEATLSDLPARIENQISIWFSHEVSVGV
jgi:hypothetical protein